MARRRGYRKIIEADLDIMPLMNLFVVLIPMLLLSAVFVELSAIEMDLPGADDSAVGDSKKSLDLAIEIDADRYLVRGDGIRTKSIDRGSEGADQQLAAHLESLRQRHPNETAVEIHSPPRVRYQEIITVMDISRAAGLAGISLVGRATRAGGRTLEAR